MDKKKQLPFNLNNFLLALSFAFVFRKKDLENTDTKRNSLYGL